MRKLVLIAAVVALAGCSKEKTAEATADANVATADANIELADANAATPAAMSLNETTWEYADPKTKKPIQESIDANGNYISTTGTEHADHGVMVMKDGKACFTSAMTKDGEQCWTVADTAIGASMETTSDKGEKLTVKRVAYVVKTM